MPTRRHYVLDIVSDQLVGPDGRPIRRPDGRPEDLLYRGVRSVDGSQVLVATGTQLSGLTEVDPEVVAGLAGWEFDPARLAQVPVPVPGVGSTAEPWVSEDLSRFIEGTYLSGQFLYPNDESPWSRANVWQTEGATTSTTGDVIFEENAGAISGHAVRYDWWGIGEEGDDPSTWCVSAGQRNVALIFPEDKVVSWGEKFWFEAYFKLSENFSVQTPNNHEGCGAGAAYKFLFFFHKNHSSWWPNDEEVPALGGRWNFNINQGRFFEFYTNSGWDWSKTPGVDARPMYDNQWRRLRIYLLSPSAQGVADGEYKVWIDDEKIMDQTGIMSDQLGVRGIQLGANKNVRHYETMSNWWSNVSAWIDDPGW